MNKTDIEWTEFTSNPIKWGLRGTGTPLARAKGWHCEKISAGCANCYAERLNLGRLGNGLPFTPAGGETLAPVLDEAELQAWLTRKKPAKIFVADMTDLFGHWVPDEMLDWVFAAMALCLQHRFQVLTKRPSRMKAYLSDPGVKQRVWSLLPTLCSPGEHLDADCARCVPVVPKNWHLPVFNIWLGVSVENQTTADERIPMLLGTPAAVRFVSYEPALGPVDFSKWLERSTTRHMVLSIPGALRNKAFKGFTDDAGKELAPKAVKAELEARQKAGAKLMSLSKDCLGFSDQTGCPGHKNPALDQIICGGESGPGARPMHPEWAQSARDQCQAAGVAFFFKQWGEWLPNCLCDTSKAHRTCPRPESGKLGVMFRCGKARTRYGRVLDGREWNEFPSEREWMA